MIDADLFEIFYLVASHGSVTEAARSLFVTKTAVSLQIKKLEQQVGTDLFIRINQRLILSENGKLLFEQCKRFHRELDETRLICKQFLTYPEGVLKVTIFEHFANKLIFPRIAQFNKLYPKIQLAMDISEEMPDFYTGGTDIAIGFASPPANEDLIRKILCKTNYVLCASHGYLERYGVPQTLDDLLQHKYICHENRIIAKQIIKLKSESLIEITPYLVLNKISAMIECARSGIGIIQVPQYVAQQYLELGELVEVLPDLQAVDKNIYYYYLKYRYVEPKIRKFIDFFIG